LITTPNPPRTDEPLNPRKPVNRLTCNEIA
jgi:hypothetical protein